MVTRPAPDDSEEEDLLLAGATGLFHDVGRFRQVVQYGTFNDRHSEDHALLGLRVLEEAGVLSPLGEDDRRAVTDAVRCHSLPRLPQSLPSRSLLLARLVRDADKLDILEVFTGHYTRRDGRPDPALDPGLPGTPAYSPVFIDNLLHHRDCCYDDMKNVNDRKLLLLSWVYDINYPFTLSEIDGKGYL
ncbi:MAG: HD domain-containing protein, partial [Chloroflexi bacterium]|nr:HD domain-containing protein [Chloroflexota bacterium]